MPTPTLRRFVVVVACACCLAEPAGAARKSRTPITSGIKGLSISPQELRIRVRSLVRPTLGIVEQAADQIRADTSDPVVRRGAIMWKIETTTTFLSALLREDPVLALADAWGYALQVQAFVERPETKERHGEFASRAAEAMVQVQDELREFAGSIGEGPRGAALENDLRAWADAHPIQGALYRRPAIDSAVAAELATSYKGGALAAVSGLQETTADVMARMDLYTMYLPRLARWEAELGVYDLTDGAEPSSLAVELERFTHAADRIAGVAERTPAMIERERAATIAALRLERLAATKDLTLERKAVIEAIHEERIATLREIEAMAQRLVERSSRPLDDAVRENVRDLGESVEAMRKRLIVDTGSLLDDAIDRAFVRGVELLLIAALLAAAGLFLNARLLRR